MKLIRNLCILLVMVSGPVWAQNSDEVDWKIAPYLWTVGLSGDLFVADGGQEVDVSYGDILSDSEKTTILPHNTTSTPKSPMEGQNGHLGCT